MKRLHDPRWFLILAFLAILVVVPLVQVVLEVRREEGVRALEVFQQPPTAANLRAFERTLESANWAAHLTRPWIQQVQFEWLRYGGSKAVLASDGWYFYKPGLQDMVARPAPATLAGGTNDPVTAILDFRDQLAARGIHLVLMPAPNKESIYPDRLAPAADWKPGWMAPRTRDVLERLRAANVEIIDLFRVFQEARRAAGAATNSAGSLYLAQDTHWTPAGVALAARTAAEFLRQRGWVTSGSTEYTTRPAPVQRLGDILRMLQVPALERSIAPETVACEQVVRGPGGEKYQDAAEAQVLVLGDSFMRIYQQDQPGAAGFIAHLARELRQPLLSLVSDGGGSTLVRRELYGRPAFLAQRKVVLWEFVERDLGLGLDGWKKVPLPPVVGPTASATPAKAGAASPPPTPRATGAQ